MLMHQKGEKRAHLSVRGPFDDELRSIRQFKWCMVSVGGDGDDYVARDSPFTKVCGGGSNDLGAHING